MQGRYTGIVGDGKRTVRVFRNRGNLSPGSLSVFMPLVAVGLILTASGLSGCRTAPSGSSYRPPPLELSLPLWLTAPRGDEQKGAPVLLGMALPPELTPFGRRFAELPPWYVYGTVRCLGADEFVASGTVRTYSMDDGRAEYRHVVDTVRYHVDAQQVESALTAATQAVAQAKDGEKRDAVLRANLRRYESGLGLFLPGAAEPAGPQGSEVFRSGTQSEMNPIGWKETASEHIVTRVGDFSYRDPINAFRVTEEDAIAELAKGILVRMAHLQKDVVDSMGSVRESATKETLSVRIRGLRVLRREVDLTEGCCRVTISAPKTGTSLAK